MSSQSTPKKRYEITNHPLAAIDHSSDEDLEIDTKDNFPCGRSRSEEISRDRFPKIPREFKHGRNLCQVSCGKLVLSNQSLIEKWKDRLWSSFERYNSVLQQALALSPFRRRIMARNRTRSLTASEGESSEVKFDRRNVIELDQVVGILRRGPLSPSNGHSFLSVIMNRPTWCDHCGKYILGYYQHCLQCPICLFTCHVICRGKVVLECPSLQLDRILGGGRKLRYETTMNACPRLAIFVDEVGNETPSMKRTTERLKMKVVHRDSDDDDDDKSSLFSMESEEEFKARINSFNENNHGLYLKLHPDSLEGSIRVHMNLFRPITCVSAPPPNSDSDDDSPHLHTYKTSFQLPRDTSKLVHINDNTTADDVIELLLRKFCIANDPRTFALYHKSTIHDNVHAMRKLNGNELPLVLCLHWFYQGQEALENNKFILQEIDPGEILWDSFSIPELDNFLTMLNREEEDHEVRIVDKFRTMKLHMERMMKEMRGSAKQWKTSKILDML